VLTAPPRRITANDSVLVCYAFLEMLSGTEQAFFVRGKNVGRVPYLAIYKERYPGHFTLYYCDRDWNSLGSSSGYQSVDAAKHQAEHIYPGSLARWIAAERGVLE
jgi:hypothetical protein